jgi:hypothetical protein
LRERPEEGVVCRERARGDVEDGERRVGEGRDGCEGGAASDVVHGDHVDGVVDVGDESELDTAFDEPPEEIIRIRDCFYDLVCEKKYEQQGN